MKAFSMICYVLMITLGLHGMRGSAQEKQQKPDRVKLDVEKFIKDLKNPDAKIRTNAAKSLMALGTEANAASAALCSATLDKSAQVRRAALEALEKVNPELYPLISTIVLDDDFHKRLSAIETLAKMGEDALPAVDFLISKFSVESSGEGPFRGLVDSDAWRGYADGGGLLFSRWTSFPSAYYATLVTVAPEDERVIKLNKKLAAERRGYGYMTALRFLYYRWAGEDETKRKEVYRLLKAAFSESRPSIEIIDMIGSYGALAKDFVPTLKRLKLSSSSEVREAAAKALEMIETP